MTIEERAKVYAKHLANTYLDPDDRVDPGVVLQLNKGTDWMEELAAMMMAMMSMTDRLVGLEEQYSDLVGFTHLLNRVAIQNSDFEDD